MPVRACVKAVSFAGVPPCAWALSVGEPPVWFQTVPCAFAAGLAPMLTTRPPRVAPPAVTPLKVGVSIDGGVLPAVVVAVPVAVVGVL